MSNNMLTALTLLLGLALPSPSLAREIAGGGNLPSGRLPQVAEPVSYDLTFEPDLQKYIFKGEEIINLRLTKPTRKLVINASELTIKKAALLGVSPGHNKEEAAQTRVNEAAEQATIIFSKLLTPGNYRLSLSFSGILNDKLRGFYRSTYMDDSGAKHVIAVTQMEPTDARRMFPCFDEPQYKANFNIRALIDPRLSAISNAAVKSIKTDPSAHRKVVEFASSPKMSTYLVALVVGEFESTPPVTSGGVPIRVWAVKGKAGLGNYAAQVAARLMPFYVSYFGVPYAGSKLDLIAIPDFEAGAMENLGAITFRQTNLLVDKEKGSTETLQSIASIVAHEMAHLWFGDLVTMKWWDDLWLNEAFATWMSVKAVDKIMPEWHVWDEFGLSRAQALQTDALQSTRPIHFAVENPNQINEMFDEITYQKGASVLRMLERFVGESVFQQGVKHYITAHQFGNACTNDLWQAIGQAAHLPVPAFMHGWVYLPGYPLITVARSGDGNNINLSQSRFLMDATGNSAAKTAPTWQVPVKLRALNGRTEQFKHLVKLSAEKAILPGSPYLANAEADGFYRVRYPAADLNAIAGEAQAKLSSAERLSLLTDQWALTISGRQPVNHYLELTAHFKGEMDPAVSKALMSQLSQLNNFIDSENRTQFERFVQDRLGEVRGKLGWAVSAKEPDLIRVLRGNVLETLGTIGQERATIDKARLLFQQYRQNPDSVDPNLLDAITEVVAYNGGDHDYEAIKNLWSQAKTPEQEQRNLYALASFRKPDLVSRTLTFAMSDQVRTQDAPRLLAHLLRAEASKEAAWQFIQSHWNEINEKFPLNMVPRIAGAASSLTTSQQEEEVRNFFAAHPVPAGEHTVARMLERLHIGVAFRRNSQAVLSSWLQHF